MWVSGRVVSTEPLRYAASLSRRPFFSGSLSLSSISKNNFFECRAHTPTQAAVETIKTSMMSNAHTSPIHPLCLNITENTEYTSEV